MPIYTVGPGKTYATIQAAVAARSGTGAHEVVVDPGIYTLTSQLNFGTGSDTSTNFMILRPATGGEWLGNPNSGVRITGAVNVVMGRFSVAHDVIFDFGGTISFFSNTFMYNVLNKSPGGYAGGFGGVSLHKCIAVRSGSIGGVGFSFADGAQNRIMGCGSFNFAAGYSGSIFTLYQNCWAAKVSGSGNLWSGSASGFSSNNASMDASTPGVNPLKNLTLQDMAFVDASGSDFHIATTSLLFGAGLNISADYQTDFDLQPIVTWCIGPDAGTVVTSMAPTTSSSPSKSDGVDHERQKDAKIVTIKKQSSQSSPPQNSNTRQTEARPPSIKSQKSDRSPGRNNKGGPGDAKSVNAEIKKGYKDGFISIIPELGGYLKGTLGSGQKIAFFIEDLNFNQSFEETNPLGKSRALHNRRVLTNHPAGAVTYTLKTNDSIPVFMSHFQKRHGSNLGEGTVYYEFAPSFVPPRVSGSSFGTGTYGSSVSNAFTVSLYKALYGTGEHYKSGLCDSLSFILAPQGVAEVKADFRFGTASILGTASMTGLGTFSSLPGLPLSTASISFGGLDILQMEFNSKNNLQEYEALGTEACTYKFGRYELTGRVSVDMPKTALAFIGSMLSGQTFPVHGTLSNSGRDKLVFQMPNCRLDYFDLKVNTRTMDIPFRAFASEDGTIPPIKLMLWTQNYSATTFEPN